MVWGVVTRHDTAGNTRLISVVTGIQAQHKLNKSAYEWH